MQNILLTTIRAHVHLYKDASAVHKYTHINLHTHAKDCHTYTHIQIHTCTYINKHTFLLFEP